MAICPRCGAILSPNPAHCVMCGLPDPYSYAQPGPAGPSGSGWSGCNNCGCWLIILFVIFPLIGMIVSGIFSSK